MNSNNKKKGEQEEVTSNVSQAKQHEIIEPRPNKYPVKVKVTQSVNTEARGKFSVDFHPYEVVLDKFAVMAAEAEARAMFNPDELDHDAYESLVHRCGFMVLAKKLAISIDPEAGLEHNSILKSIYQVKVTGPLGLVTLADCYGYVDDPKEGRWDMLGQVALAEHFFIRAVATRGEVGPMDRMRMTCVNLHHRDALRRFREVMCGMINAWGQSLGTIDMRFGPDVIMHGKLPMLEGQGAAALSVLVQGIDRPARVINAFAVAAAIDAVLQRDVNGVPNQQEQQVLQGLDVLMVVWNRELRDSRIASYAHDVQMKIHRTMSRITNWAEVQKFVDRGKIGQLTSRVNERHASSPVEQAGESIEFGSLLAGESYFIKPNLVFELSSEEMQVLKLTAYAQGMVRGGRDNF